MKVVSHFLTFAIALSSCADESESPDLTPGTYYLEVFNDNGEKVLTRSGAATGLGSYSQITFEDPQFFTSHDDDSLTIFAYLQLTTGNEYDVWDQKLAWSMDSPFQATLNQHYYSINGDWGYENVSGEVMITKSNKSLLEGRFSIAMVASDSKWEIEWNANPQWGDRIVVKGRFSSKGW